jgi:FkbM family methyltransferase
MDPWVIDVGASYGFESIYTAQQIRDAGRSGVVVGFEPGVAGTLLPQNVALNGVADRVRVEQAAVGAYTGFALMFGEDGHSENNRIVNRWLDMEAFSRVVPVTALDDYVERNGITADLIVKVDTQGGEPEVLDGMTRLLRDRVTTLVIEFSPSAVRARVAPEELLTRLARHGTIVDLGQRGPLAPAAAGFPVVEEGRFAAFAEEVLARAYEWSDLLVVPFNLPNRDALLKRLAPRPAARSEAA